MYTFQQLSGSHPSVLWPVVKMSLPVIRTLLENVGCVVQNPLCKVHGAVYTYNQERCKKRGKDKKEGRGKERKRKKVYFQRVCLDLPACLSCARTRRNTARHNTARHNTPRHTTAHHGTPRHTTPRHGTPQHGTPRYKDTRGQAPALDRRTGRRIFISLIVSPSTHKKSSIMGRMSPFFGKSLPYQCSALASSIPPPSTTTFSSLLHSSQSSQPTSGSFILMHLAPLRNPA